MQKFLIALFALFFATAALAQTPDTVFMERLTSPEIRDAIAAGKTTVILPSGGTEQNGPNMAVGKHNFRALANAQVIARRLGNARCSSTDRSAAHRSGGRAAAHDTKHRPGIRLIRWLRGSNRRRRAEQH